jgi:hypothetical protein
MRERAAGMLSENALRELVKKGDIDTVLTVFPDLYGRLVGKRYTGAFFCDHVLAHGMLQLSARLRHGDGSGAGLPLRVVGEGLRRRAVCP